MNLTHKYYRYLLFLIIGVSIGINIVTIKDGHNWGGDFSQYIMHAQNILQGKAYASNIMLELPVVYPPGYALLIAPVIKYAGVNFPLLKLLNVFFWFLSIAFMYPIFCQRMSRTHAVLSSLVLCYSSFFFSFKQNVISDVAFVFFSNASLYFFVRFLSALQESSNREVERRILFLFFIIVASMAFMIRTAGVILFIAATFYLLFIKKNFKALGGIILAFLCVLFWQRSIIGVQIGFFSDIKESPLLFFATALKNISLSFRSALWFFIDPHTQATQGIYFVLDKMMAYLGGFFCLLILYYFIKGVVKKTLTFVGCFSFFYFLMLVAWSGFPHHPANFSRYVLPVIGPLLIYMVEKIDKPISIVYIKRKEKWRLAVNYFLISLLVVNLFNIGGNFDFNDDVLFQEKNQELFTWIKSHLKEKDHYMIWQARPVRLMTDHLGAVPWRYKKGHNVRLSQRVKELNIRYIIATKGYDDQLIQLLKTISQVTLVWENSAYEIYKVL